MRVSLSYLENSSAIVSVLFSFLEAVKVKCSNITNLLSMVCSAEIDLSPYDSIKVYNDA